MAEENDSEKNQLQNTAIDYVASGVKATLGAIPFAGSLLSEIAGAVIPKQRIDRITDFAKRLERRIAHLERDAVRSEMDDEEFTDLVEESLRQAARATSEQRREYLASLLANSLSKDAVEHSESRHLLRLLGELSDVEVIWLRFYNNPAMGGDEQFRALHEVILEPVAAHMGSTQDELDKAALQKSYKAHLERLGLIAGKLKIDRNNNPELDKKSGEFKRQSYRTTSLGRLLLQSIDLNSELNL